MKRVKTRLVWARRLWATGEGGDSSAHDPSGHQPAKLSSERSRAERELQMVSNAIAHAAIGVMRLDLEGRIREANGYLCRLLGYSREELLRMTAFDLTVGLEASAWPRRWEELKERETTTFERGYRTKSGAIIPVEISSSVVEFEGEEFDHAFIRDISERKQAEEALRLARFSIDFASDCTSWLDSEGRFVDISESACARLGYSRDELLTMSVFDVTVDLSPDVWPDHMREIKEAGPLTFESLKRTKDGKIFPVEISATIIEHGGREYNVGIMRDITERVQMVESLRRTQFVVDHSQDLIHWLDAEGRFLYVNDACCRRLGYSREELLGMTINGIDPLSPRPWSSHFQEIGERGTFTFESLHQTKDGEIYPVEVTVDYFNYGGKEYSCASARDITERRRVEETLRSSEDRYRQLFDLESDAIFLVDDESGQFLEANEAAISLYGYSREEWPSMKTTEVSAEADKTRKATAEHLTYIPLRWHRKKDGTVFPVEITTRHLDWGGRAVHIAAMRDITERLRTEQALRERDDQLRQSQKMEAVGQLAGGIAHDFNNLLAAILGYSDLLLARKELADSGTREDLEEIKHAAERAATLTRQILAFSRRQALQPTVASLNDVLDGMEPLLCRTLGEDIDLLSLKDPDLGNVEADVHQFEQVMMNLAVNARDAMSPGGRLTLETANVELDEEFCRTHPGATPGSHVMLSVSDTGVGMDDGTRERVFEPFFTTKGPGAGTGLGLAMVYGIVKQSNGSIFVESEPGQGSTFKIYLPRVRVPVKDDNPLADNPAPVRGQETILLVEDETSLRNLVARVLGGLGYRVLAAGTSAEALQVAREADDSFDLLLTDVVLPGGVQGNDLARDLLALRADLPVLYMSGYTRDAIVHAGRLDEGVNFLEKPFTPKALGAKVREVLDRPRTSG